LPSWLKAPLSKAVPIISGRGFGDRREAEGAKRTSTSHPFQAKAGVFERRNRYPVVLPEYWACKDDVNPYCFMDALFKELGEGEIVVTGNGTACVTSFQAAVLKRGQRLVSQLRCSVDGF